MTQSDQSEKACKLSEQLSSLNKLLEASFKYQIVIILAFYIYVHDKSDGVLKFGELEISKETFMLIIPIALLYFVSKMAVLSMLFIEVSDNFFFCIDRFKDDKDEYQYHRLFRPRTIFISIPLTRHAYGSNKASPVLNYFISSIIYMLPGFSMALCCYTIVTYQRHLFSVLFLILAAIAFTLLFMEFYKGAITRKYRYLLYVTYATFLISFTLMLALM